MADDLVNIGLSEAGNARLDYLKNNGYFAEKLDAYRFAVGLALASGGIAPELAKRHTFLNVGSFDPNQSFKRSVEALVPDLLENTTVYRIGERLADWGDSELHQQAEHGGIDFTSMFAGLISMMAG